MDDIFSRGKHYEQLVLGHETVYNDIVAAIAIVKEFITANKLIVYGGSAIDYALRLHGDSIYNDSSLTVPDLDFYSPTHAEHSYALADILFDAGYTSARAIVATYQRTMRVDAIDNHFIADISYVPPEIFEQLPYLVYENMRIIHPDFQRIDIHSALSVPYGNPPTEDIFSRWKKDIERFNKLDIHYPIVVPKLNNTLQMQKITIPLELKRYVFTGMAAYSVIYGQYVRDMGELNAITDQTIPPAEFIVGAESITISVIDSLELAHTHLDKIATELTISGIELYETYINLLPEMLFGSLGDIPLRVISTKNKLIASNRVQFTHDGDNSTVRIRITNIHFVLKYFLSMYFRNRKRSPTAAIYLKYYCGLIKMISTYEIALSASSQNASSTQSTDNASQRAHNHPLFPSLDVYGNDNNSLSYEVNMMWTKMAIERGPRPQIPTNYYPAKTRVHPTFDPSTSPIFAESGKQIVKE